MRISRIISLAAALIIGAAVHADAPARVVSINLCTDQLALLIAAPGQLVSVSRLAQDPQSSTMVDAARALPVNGSGAEEVYLLKPDLVLAGTFTAPATVAMLRGLGIEVAVFAPVNAISDVPDRMARMGAVLGRQAAADALITQFEADRAALSIPPAARPRAALTYVNSYTVGRHTLAGDILHAAGFDNVADEAGLSAGGTLPLEQLVLLAPDVIIQGRNYPGAARAEDNLDHPALSALKGTYVVGELTDRDWVCGTPNVLDALANMVALRKQIAAR